MNGQCKQNQEVENEKKMNLEVSSHLIKIIQDYETSFANQLLKINCFFKHVFGSAFFF